MKKFVRWDLIGWRRDTISQKNKKTKKQKIGRYFLYVAKDKGKDQSYFLYNLTQEILARVEFPLGNYTKKQVKAMAKKWKLPVLESESQDICFLEDTDHFERVGRGDFINLKKLNPPFPVAHERRGTESPFAKVGNKKVDHNEFLKKHLKLKKGNIVNLEGEKIGEHNGLPLYTIGQRRAVGIGGTGPYYVVRKDIKNNILFVSEDRDDKLIYSSELIAGDVNWISGKEPKLPLKIKAKIRYRHDAAEAIVRSKVKSQKSKVMDSVYIVKFKETQRAITSGQSVVFYKGAEVIGGGVIC